MSGRWFEPSRPRRVEGGVRVRRVRGSIGEQWWSRRFIDVLEATGLRNRLIRGRSYARSGQVVELRVAPGAVTARVQGSRAHPYRVGVFVDVIAPRDWSRVEAVLARQAIFRAQLLAGEMPPDIEEVFAALRLSLFPRSAADLNMSCSCPDWEVPCKHLAATLYVLAEAFDDDPFLVLAWRGREREELLAGLRSRASEPAACRGGLFDVQDRPLAECAGDYWTPGESPRRLRERPPVPAAPGDLLLRILDPPAVRVAGRDLVEALAPAYARLTGVDDDHDAGSSA